MKKKPARRRKPKRLLFKYVSPKLSPRDRELLDQARLPPLDYSVETVHLERIRDLELQLGLKSNWPVPMFNYADHVKVIPLDYIKARVVDLHVFGQMKTVEYDVRYFHEGKEFKARLFEDELERCR